MLAHSLVAVLLIILLTGVSEFLEFMGDHRLFQRIPLSYIFDAMDCAILLVFGAFGVLEATKAFKGTDVANSSGAVGAKNRAIEGDGTAGKGTAGTM